jgi:uncharacterized protein YukJ
VRRLPGLREYGLLKGKVTGYSDNDARQDPYSPHVQIFVGCNGYKYKVQINVKSSRNIRINGVKVPNELLYLADYNFNAEQITHLQSLKQGYYPIKRYNSFVEGNADFKPKEIAIDYIRSELFNPCDMKADKQNLSWSDKDLVDFLIKHIKAARYKDATIYVYGEPFDNPLGMHDVHMNQGSNSLVTGDKGNLLKGSDGVYQDGCILLQYKSHWEAIFLAFRSQSWCTDDINGHKIKECHIYNHRTNKLICDIE